MAEEPVLQTLVQLASLGAAGVCIFAIFWTGFLIQRLPPNAGGETHTTLRFFIKAAVAMAALSGVSGAANAWFGAERQEELRSGLEETKANLESCQDEVASVTQTLTSERTKNREVAESLKLLLAEKEVAALESNASREIQASIRILKKSIDRLSGAVQQ